MDIVSFGDQGNWEPYFFIILFAFIIPFVKRTSSLLIMFSSLEEMMLLIMFFLKISSLFNDLVDNYII